MLILTSGQSMTGCCGPAQCDDVGYRVHCAVIVDVLG